MTDQRSFELLEFNFASRTVAYKRLARGLSRALSAYSIFMREYLDKMHKTGSMSTVCRRYRNCQQYQLATHTQHTGNVRVHHKSGKKTHNRQMTLCSHRNQISRSSKHSSRNSLPGQQNQTSFPPKYVSQRQKSKSNGCSTKDLHLLQLILRNVPRLPRICLSHPMGNHTTNACHK